MMGCGSYPELPLWTFLQIGESKGTNPKLATVNAMAMVANGAERALPTVVRRSNETPNVESHKMALRT